MLNNFPVSISGFCRSGLKGDTFLQGSRIAVIIAQKKSLLTWSLYSWQIYMTNQGFTQYMCSYFYILLSINRKNQIEKINSFSRSFTNLFLCWFCWQIEKLVEWNGNCMQWVLAEIFASLSGVIGDFDWVYFIILYYKLLETTFVTGKFILGDPGAVSQVGSKRRVSRMW